MPARLRSTFAAIAAFLVCATSSAPAGAVGVEEHQTTPVVFDAIIVRPLGFATFVFGTAMFVVSLPIVAVTRPQDIDKPWDHLVVAPARFVWGDKLGGH